MRYSLPLRLAGPVCAVMAIAFGVGLLALVATGAFAATTGESAATMAAFGTAVICGALALTCAAIGFILLACDILISR